jgi:hypothetical protein
MNIMSTLRLNLLLVSCWAAAGSLDAHQAPIAPTAAPPPAEQTPGGPAGRGRGGRGGGTPLDYAENEGWVSLFNGQNLNGGPQCANAGTPIRGVRGGQRQAVSVA